jgi:hypothetical protein
MDINQILDKPFTFTRRQKLIPSDLRPIWKASLVLLIFGILNKKNKCSLKKVHIANWISKSESHLDDFLYWVNDTNGIRPDIRMEPALDRVLEMLVGDALLIKSNGRLEITESGYDVFNKLNESATFEVEKKYFMAVKKYMTEANVERIFKVV